MGLLDSFFGSSSRRSNREWYGRSSNHGSSSRQGYSSYEPSSSSRQHSSNPYSGGSSRRYREGISEPYYNYTRDDRRYSFGRREARNEQVHFRRPEVDHRDFYGGRVPETARAHYSRDPYSSRHPKPYHADPHRTAQREHERNYHYGVGGYGSSSRGHGGGFGYQDRSAASYLEMDGRYPRFR
ncbi:hypothetical protein CLAFUW4_05302 [Fulvia fulva]|uniref:Uncharacterized protein n=1 Tax=Passalora fulva TaxID=5499 RepID=A0A9Q8LHC6_PASFU|nr:uncharacterized protein CLAFUR5_05450 [Fulvia fulva]KAK4624708.1 hypothetical protein CLAFUR4_05296 [Fulvia fulva]KAK4624813.1 hypothetical protein CLAFUR0_05303 [Fulvia fulva]UJO17646.1 hypothetical protein CLAFUR5_05450 [Fulvia fulva]WPV14846.1 hypothetical protein CLAFUW4_05302 [Fulvia fulva]WPV29619.1 hypothetical protein CLAFUW7_05301 [Fulvia fulva]